MIRRCRKSKLEIQVFRLAVFLALTLICSAGQAQQEPKPTAKPADRAAAKPAARLTKEYQVKLAFIYGFAIYVKNAKPAAKQQVVIGIMGKDPFGQFLDRVAETRKVHGKKIVIKRFKNAADYQKCDIVFVPGGTPQDEITALIKMTRSTSVLIVGEQKGFTQAGGVINFYINAEGKIGIQLHVDNMKKQQLQVDARLMKLCDIVANKK